MEEFALNDALLLSVNNNSGKSSSSSVKLKTGTYYRFLLQPSSHFSHNLLLINVLFSKAKILKPAFISSEKRNSENQFS